MLIEHEGEIKIFEQLLRYQLKYRDKSKTWHNKLIQSVGLLFDYMNANPNNYASAKNFFELFEKPYTQGLLMKMEMILLVFIGFLRSHKRLTHYSLH